MFGRGRWIGLGVAVTAIAAAIWIVWGNRGATTHVDGQPVPSAVSPAPADAVERRGRIAELARFEPPRYEPAKSHATPGGANRAFQSAMMYYADGDFRTAANALSEILRKAPDVPEVNFYAGIALLVNDQPWQAMEAFDRVAGGASAFVEPARFFRAKTYLRLADVDSATRDLTALAAGDGPHAAEARRMLAVLRQK